jgi:hypothetical protein
MHYEFFSFSLARECNMIPRFLNAHVCVQTWFHIYIFPTRSLSSMISVVTLMTVFQEADNLA